MNLKIKVSQKKYVSGEDVLLVGCRSDLLGSVIPEGLSAEDFLNEAVARFLYYYDMRGKPVYVSEDLGFKCPQWTYEIETNQYPSRPFFISELDYTPNKSHHKRWKTIAWTRTKPEADQIRNLAPEIRQVTKKMTKDFDFFHLETSAMNPPRTTETKQK